MRALELSNPVTSFVIYVLQYLEEHLPLTWWHHAAFSRRAPLFSISHEECVHAARRKC